MEKNVEFVSYDGKYPTLCSGTLVIRVNNKEYSLTGILTSGGSCGHYGVDGDWDDEVEIGKWIIWKKDLPEAIQPFVDKIIDIVNKNVPFGCCGGCI